MAARRPAARTTRTRPRTRSARASRATCAAAPATRTSSRPCRPQAARRSGNVDDRRHDRHRAPAGRDRPGPQAQGGPAPDHRPHHVDRQHRAARACCTWRSCAARSRTPRSPRIDTTAGASAPRRRRRRSPAQDFADDAGQPAVRLAGHRRTWSTPATRRSPSTRSTTPARSSRSSSPATKAEAQDALEAIDVDYEPLPAGARHGGGARRRRRPRPPGHRRRTSPTPGCSTPARPAPARRSSDALARRRGDASSAGSSSSG